MSYLINIAMFIGGGLVGMVLMSMLCMGRQKNLADHLMGENRGTLRADKFNLCHMKKADHDLS
jgi:hypothetical protein